MESRITDLEVKLAYQEDTVEKLSEALAAQQIELVKMAAEIKSLIQQSSDASSDGSDDVPPPHY